VSFHLTSQVTGQTAVGGGKHRLAPPTWLLPNRRKHHMCRALYLFILHSGLSSRCSCALGRLARTQSPLLLLAGCISSDAVCCNCCARERPHTPSNSQTLMVPADNASAHAESKRHLSLARSCLSVCGGGGGIQRAVIAEFIRQMIYNCRLEWTFFTQ
jgi:hypothetical protein